MGGLKLEVEPVFVYISYLTVNMALGIARFLPVSCRITCFLHPLQRSARNKQQQQSLLNLSSLYASTKLKASGATINIESSLLTFYIYISLEPEIDLKFAQRRQAF